MIIPMNDVEDDEDESEEIYSKKRGNKKIVMRDDDELKLEMQESNNCKERRKIWKREDDDGDKRGKFLYNSSLLFSWGMKWWKLRWEWVKRCYVCLFVSVSVNLVDQRTDWPRVIFSSLLFLSDRNRSEGGWDKWLRQEDEKDQTVISTYSSLLFIPLQQLLLLESMHCIPWLHFISFSARKDEEASRMTITSFLFIISLLLFSRELLLLLMLL